MRPLLIGGREQVHLVQLLLPVYRPRGRRFPRASFEQVSRELTQRFGGATAYSRAPAKGLWKPAGGRTQRDDVIVVEVMVARLDRRWWRRFRLSLEKRFEQQELVVRAHAIRKL